MEEHIMLADSNYHHNTQEESTLRRSILRAAPCTLLFSTQIANAAAETTAESIRLLSSKTIPGLGPPDVYYPPYFVGRWKVTKVITKSDDSFWEDMKQSGVDLPVTIKSEMRFVPYDAGKDFIGDDNPNNVPAIADRSFNERSYYASISEELNKLLLTTKPMSSIRQLDWTPTNPNVLSINYQDGSSKEIKVTKRSNDVEKDESAMFSSEFRRVTVVPASSGGPAGGIPSIYKSRVLTKWKKAGEGTIEGIEIMYNERGVFGEQKADPLLGVGKGENTKDMSDWRSTKTRILMERIVG